MAATPIALVRHAATAWNEAGRIQGSIDIPLSDAGRAQMAALAPPAGFEQARAYCSPLQRARETAALLGFADAIIDARLAEHRWGRWEGMTGAEILAQDGADAFARAGSGFDFTPPDGETTRAFFDRVTSFLKDIAARKEKAIAITHRGVMRTAYALATGWDLSTPWPKEVDFSAALVLALDGESVRIAALNAPLMPRKARGA